MSITAIGVLVPRLRCTVDGRIIRATSYQRPWVRTDVELSDGSGDVVLRFIGRAGVHGFRSGRRVVASGTPGLHHGDLVILNPIYTFVADG